MGDPPNIIIGSAADFHFATFLVYSLPVAIVVWIVAVVYILHTCRRDNKIKPKYIHKLMDLDARKSIIKPIILKKSL